MSRIRIVSLALGAGLLLMNASAEPLSLREKAFFDMRVAPVLQENCLSCHGAGKAKSDLRLDSAAAILKGGTRGPALEAGDPEASVLLQAIRHTGDLKMPPGGHLDEKAIADIANWVMMGAPWPEEVATLETPLNAKLPDAPAASAVLAHQADKTEEVRAKVDVPRVTFDIQAGEPLSFDTHIRPILSNKCFACHGPDAAARKAGLRLDLEDEARKALPSGHFALVAGSLDESQLLHRIAAADPDDLMPPADFNKPVTQEEADLLARWILQGSVWEQHWSFEKPRRAAPPVVAEMWRDHVRNPIDNFILSKLPAQHLEPSPEADRRTLIRRLSFDLTGLPPTPDEVNTFVKDTSPKAYENLVDRLFASPRYSEHMARYWLDAARYADTNGYHIDNARDMWRWRDWVIDAFNKNMPFDQFTIEQLAGDLLPEPTLNQLIASGFNRNHMINFEGGIIPEEYRVAYVVDRVNTTSTVWLGITMNCAQCHDHKYDPITQREFYEFYAYFNTIAENGSDGNDGNAVPNVSAPLPEQAEAKAALDVRLASLRDQLAAPMPEADTAQTKWEADQREALAARWTVLQPDEFASLGGATFDKDPDGTLHASGVNPDSDTYEVAGSPGMSEVTAVRLEVFRDDANPNKSNGRATNGNFVLTGFELEVVPADVDAAVQPVTFRSANADFAQADYPVANAIDDKKETGWASEGQAHPEDRTAIFVPDRPVFVAPDAKLRFRLKHESAFGGHNIGRFRLAVSDDPTLKGATLGPWHMSGPFVAEDGQQAFDTAYPPEQGVDLNATYPDGRQQWVKYTTFPDETIQSLPGDVCATYLYRSVTAPSPRTMTLSLGSNDALRVWANGVEVHSNNVQRGGEADQDTVEVPLHEGENDLLFKVVNYGNAYAFYFRNAGETAGDIPLDLQLVLARNNATRTDAQRVQLRDFYRRMNSPEYQALATDLTAVEAEYQSLIASIPTTMVMGEMDTPRDTFILKRGEYDQPTELVTPGVPASLPPLPQDEPNNRLALAKWLVSPEQPLTARVVMNRYWEHIFGTGLVKTVEDFGVQGERPVNQALLDWLAVEFVESGWDLQHMLRLMVTCEAYRQQSNASADDLELDRANRYLARAPRFRLDAEVVRDNALALSGLLVEKRGGPSVSPYQPPGIWEEVAYGSNFTAQTFVQGTGDELYRRSMYTFWKRQSPPPSMMLFDAPNRESCSVRRSRTNTPLQALALMNDPQFVEAARVMAQRVLAEAPGTPEERVAYAFELATARAPKPEELRVLLSVYESERADFETHADAASGLIGVGDSEVPEVDAAELAAWSTVTSIILNLDETITKS